MTLETFAVCAGWFSNVLIIVGMYYLGQKRRAAFLWSIAGETIWIGKSLYLGHYDLAFICGLFCVMAIRNWWKWGEEESKPESAEPEAEKLETANIGVAYRNDVDDFYQGQDLSVWAPTKIPFA